MSLNTVLHTLDLTKHYGQFLALDSVTLEVKEGDIYGLIGRNGAGKTTLFKCIMGLARPSAGRILIAGESANLNLARRQMGFMINPSFYPYLSGKANLEFLCKVRGINTKSEVSRLLELVGLATEKKPYKTYSMGMRQRLGIAAALLGSPPIVLLDEPINGLDLQGIIDIREVIRRINTETGTTFVISSHILAELDLLATRFCFIEQGRLLKEISRQELHQQTEKSLLITVNNATGALAVLESMGVSRASVDGNQLRLRTNLDQSSIIARALIENGFELSEMHLQETTLEEYFVQLIGGL